MHLRSVLFVFALCLFSMSLYVWQDFEVNECLKQLMMSLLRAYRFSPIIPDLGFQVRHRRLGIKAFCSDWENAEQEVIIQDSKGGRGLFHCTDCFMFCRFPVERCNIRNSAAGQGYVLLASKKDSCENGSDFKYYYNCYSINITTGMLFLLGPFLFTFLFCLALISLD